MRRLSIPFLLLLTWISACTGSSPTEPEKWTIDPTFVGTYNGTYPLGTVSFRVYGTAPSKEVFLANFKGQLTFTLSSTGETTSYDFYGTGNAALFYGDILLTDGFLTPHMEGARKSEPVLH